MRVATADLLSLLWFDASPGKPIATVKQKNTSIIAAFLFLSVFAVLHTVQMCSSIVKGQNEAVTTKMHTCPSNNFSHLLQ